VLVMPVYLYYAWKSRRDYPITDKVDHAHAFREDHCQDPTCWGFRWWP
jgi:hypothetical protein